MYIEFVPNRNSPPAILLRESYREDGKVKKRTLANFSKCPPHAIQALKASLKGKSQVVDAVDRMMAHFEANGIGSTNPGLGAPLTTDGKDFTGEFAAAATQLDREHYREGHTLPNA